MQNTTIPVQFLFVFYVSQKLSFRIYAYTLYIILIIEYMVYSVLYSNEFLGHKAIAVMSFS